MNFRILLTIVFGLITSLVYSQVDQRCSTDEERRALWEKNPELETKFYEYNDLLRSMDYNFDRDGEEDEEDILPDHKVAIIPVVFHVLHDYGVENISDAQIMDQMRILNQDYRKQNPDIVDVIPEMMDRAADTKIEFRLATVDPFGNPTNGIVRYYTHETFIGDAASKLNQWPRGRYLNVWVTRYANGPTTAGYSHHPSDVEGGARYMDGVVLQHGHIGSIGTASVANSRSLTHEIGHWLNLAHTWGGTNEPGVACGDDGVDDTPPTKGRMSVGSCAPSVLYSTTGCPPNAPVEVENVQNYMDYAYCDRMYTKGQAVRMRNALRLDVAQRSNLWTDANHLVTIPSWVEKEPVADFFVDYQATNNRDKLVLTVGNTVKLRNWSYSLSDNVEGISYLWEFEDANVETSDELHPTISFNSPGWKTVSLTVNDNGKINKITKEDFFFVVPDWPVYSGNVQFDFEPSSNEYWAPINPHNYEFQWKVVEGAGVNGSSGIFLDLSNPYVDYTQFSDGYFFDARRGGSKSTFVSQPISLNYMSNITVSFDYACATQSMEAEEIEEKLIVYISTNNGNTWNKRTEIGGTDLVNNGAGWDSFFPNPQTTIWTTGEFVITNAQAAGNNVLLKFEYVASDNSNNIAIDNIRINGTLSTSELQSDNNISVYPNPTDMAKGWNISYDPTIWGGGEVQLTDMSGRLVSSTILPANQNELNIKPANGAAQGVYFLQITNNEKVVKNKLILN